MMLGNNMMGNNMMPTTPNNYPQNGLGMQQPNMSMRQNMPNFMNGSGMQQTPQPPQGGQPNQWMQSLPPIWQHFLNSHPDIGNFSNHPQFQQFLTSKMGGQGMQGGPNNMQGGLGQQPQPGSPQWYGQNPGTNPSATQQNNAIPPQNLMTTNNQMPGNKY